MFIVNKYINMKKFNNKNFKIIFSYLENVMINEKKFILINLIAICLIIHQKWEKEKYIGSNLINKMNFQELRNFL